MTEEERPIMLQKLYAGISQCHACRLCEHRTLTVPGEGPLNAPVMFVGEGPGSDEDISGRPFVGRAGQLLDTLLAEAGLNRSELYIANIVKCRPENNRTPAPDEVSICLKWLRMQFAVIKPKIIYCLGSPAGKAIISPEFKISRDRGCWLNRNGIWICSTFHPAYILRNTNSMPLVRHDLDLLRNKCLELGLTQGVYRDL